MLKNVNKTDLQDEIVEDTDLIAEKKLKAEMKDKMSMSAKKKMTMRAGYNEGEDYDEDDEDEDEDDLDEDLDLAINGADDATFAAIKASAKKVAKKPVAKKSRASAEMPKTKLEDVDFGDDLDALVEGEATLSEAFREKAGVIFEAAMASKLSEAVDSLEDQYAEVLSEEITAVKTDLVEKVDSYLNYVVESWMEENKLAVDSGLRSEISESFMEKLQSVFSEHYIEVPESKADLVEELALKVEELEESYNEEVQKAMSLYEANKILMRDKIISENSADLSAAQGEKLKSLVEDVDFRNEKAFTSKIATIKESYFKIKTVVVKDEAEELQESGDPIVSSRMESYLTALKKSH